MKLFKLLPIFALCASAHADTLGILENQSGGVIVITDMKQGCPNHPGAAYAVSGKSNTTYWGCWYTDDIMVHIDWKDGEKTSYLIKRFTFNDENVRRFTERNPRRGGGQSL